MCSFIILPSSMSTDQEISCCKSISDVLKNNKKKKEEVVILPLFANASVAAKNCDWSGLYP